MNVIKELSKWMAAECSLMLTIPKKEECIDVYRESGRKNNIEALISIPIPSDCNFPIVFYVFLLNFCFHILRISAGIDIFPNQYISIIDLKIALIKLWKCRKQIHTHIRYTAVFTSASPHILFCPYGIPIPD